MENRRNWLLVPSPFLGPASWNPVADVLNRRNQVASVSATSMTSTQDLDHLTPWLNQLLELDPVEQDVPTVVVAHSAACPRTPILVHQLIGKGWPIEAMILVDGRFPDGKAFTESHDRFSKTLDSMVRPDDYLPPWPRWWGSLVQGLVVDPVARELVFNEASPIPRGWFDQPCPVPELPTELKRGFISFGPGYADACQAALKAGWNIQRLGGDHLHQVVDPEGVTAALIAMVDCAMGDSRS